MITNRLKKYSKSRFRSVFYIFIISAASGNATNKKDLFCQWKKNGNVNSLTQS